MARATIVLAQAEGEATEPQPNAGAADAPADTHAATEAHGEGHGAFPPFDGATFGSQILWLAITFGLLYYLMARVALPRIGTILEERNDRIADDRAEAVSLKRQTDQAIAAYEQALAEARRTAHGIGEEAREGARAEADAERSRIEADLDAQLKAAEAGIGKVRAAAIDEIDTIARDAAAALVEVLAGKAAAAKDVAAAVDAVLAGRS